MVAVIPLAKWWLSKAQAQPGVRHISSVTAAVITDPCLNPLFTMMRPYRPF
jgi:hypothetical protein